MSIQFKGLADSAGPFLLVPMKKRKRGEVRLDGRIYWGQGKRLKSTGQPREQWLTTEAYKSRSEWLAEYKRKRKQIDTDYRAAYYSDHKEERATRKRLMAIRTRARRNGIEFSITEKDIVVPAVCPVLGIPLRLGTGKRGGCSYSPSVDRIDNTKGYVPGNVIVVSYRANKLKNDATPQELQAIASFYSKLSTTASAPRREPGPAPR